ncbi:hypothetical protein Ade02nite_15590 [Paractinoplanes deccanensis]|uniref:Uncharacterized protein n=1 Tax=Paractinoplanes deccanensis TaxID=113561 RepID=A0ABQ3XYU7_9ACTN|nr:hypothetical protein Ade02nite_15590 [Actinoplanes deccanensis]
MVAYKVSTSSPSPHRGERVTPGLTALTRIGASSTASARVSESMAPQMLDATDQPGEGRSPAVPVVSVMEPPGRRWGRAARTAASAPK